MPLVEQSPALLDRNHTDYVYDFFGPSIDTGFRVIGACSRRYFTLSLEVLWALHRAGRDGTTKDKLDDLAWMGGCEFKGVWSGKEYPLFAIDREYKDPLNMALRDLTGPRIASREAIEDICDACYSSSTWPSKIYLPDSGFVLFKKEPPQADPLVVDEVALTGGQSQGDLEDEHEYGESPGTEDLEEDPPFPEVESLGSVPSPPPDSDSY